MLRRCAFTYLRQMMLRAYVLIEKRLEQDRVDCGFNFKTWSRAVMVGTLTVIFPLLFILNMLVSTFNKDFLLSLLGASFTESILLYLCDVKTVTCQHSLVNKGQSSWK